MFNWIKRRLINKALKEIGKQPEIDNTRIKILKSIRDELDIISDIYENYISPVPNNNDKKNWIENLIQQIITQKLGSGLNMPNIAQNIPENDDLEKEIQKLLKSIKK